jgi:hypothetical protein
MVQRRRIGQEIGVANILCLLRHILLSTQWVQNIRLGCPESRRDGEILYFHIHVCAYCPCYDSIGTIKLEWTR